MTLPKLMHATNLFGRGLGSRRIKLILDEYPNILTSSESIAKKYDKVKKIKGFADKTAARFVKQISSFMKFVSLANLNHKLKKQQKQKDTTHPLYQKKIVMTGPRNKELIKKIKAATGCSLHSSVSKKTFVVLVKDLDVDTGKVEQAREKGVPLMTWEDFTEKYLNI